MNIYKTIKKIYNKLIYNPLCLLTSGLPEYNISSPINKTNNINNVTPYEPVVLYEH